MKHAVISVATMLSFAGCANTGQVIPAGSPCVVSAPHAALYKYGPAQSFGADLSLDHGARVTMIERGLGYSRVMTENGITGYVSNDDYEPVAAEPKKKAEPVVTGRTLPRAFSGPVRRSQVAPTPGDPLFDVNDSPLPAQDDAPLKPQFRINPKPKPAPEPPKKP